MENKSPEVVSLSRSRGNSIEIPHRRSRLSSLTNSQSANFFSTEPRVPRQEQLDQLELLVSEAEKLLEIPADQRGSSPAKTPPFKTIADYVRVKRQIRQLFHSKAARKPAQASSENESLLEEWRKLRVSSGQKEAGNSEDLAAMSRLRRELMRLVASSELAEAQKLLEGNSQTLPASKGENAQKKDPLPPINSPLAKKGLFNVYYPFVAMNAGQRRKVIARFKKLCAEK